VMTEDTRACTTRTTSITASCRDAPSTVRRYPPRRAEAETTNVEYQRLGPLNEGVAGDATTSGGAELDLGARCSNGRTSCSSGVQKDGRGLLAGRGAWPPAFDTAAGRLGWQVHEIRYAGRRLYRGRRLYSDSRPRPQEPNVLYISTDRRPCHGRAARQPRGRPTHRELYRGATADFGTTWTWTAITANSDADNLRPIVPKWDGHADGARVDAREHTRTITASGHRVVASIPAMNLYLATCGEQCSAAGGRSGGRDRSGRRSAGRPAHA